MLTEPIQIQKYNQVQNIILRFNTLPRLPEKYIQAGWTSKTEGVEVLQGVFLSDVTELPLFSDNFCNCVGLIYTGINSESGKRVACITHGNVLNITPLPHYIREMHKLKLIKRNEVITRNEVLNELCWYLGEIVANDSDANQVINNFLTIIKKMKKGIPISDEEFNTLADIYNRPYSQYQKALTTRITEVIDQCAPHTCQAIIIGGLTARESALQVSYQNCVTALQETIHKVSPDQKISKFGRNSIPMNFYFDTPHGVLYGHMKQNCIPNE